VDNCYKKRKEKNMFNKIKTMPLSVAVILVFALSTPTFAQIAVIGTDTQIVYPTEISGGVTTTTGTDPVTTEIYGSTTSKVSEADCAEWLRLFNSWMTKANEKLASAKTSSDIVTARNFKDTASGYYNKINANPSVCPDPSDLATQLAKWSTDCQAKKQALGIPESSRACG
jgi:hypothetical protein